MNKLKLFSIFIFLFIGQQACLCVSTHRLVSLATCYGSNINPIPEMQMSNEAKKIKFDNGLTLIYKENPSNEIVAIDLFIKSGNWYENDSNSGITNFTQQLLLKGTKTKTSEELAFEIESIGGIINTDTADDYAEIYVIITKKYFAQGIEILFDVIKNPSFLNAEIEKERNIILAQIKSKEDNIFETTYDLFNDTLYGKYPYHKPILGNEQTILSINRNDLISSHKEFYTPENMVLVVAGNIKETKVIKHLEKIFNSHKSISAIKKQSIETKSAQETEYFQIPEREIPYTQTYPKKFKQAYLMLGYLLPEGSSSDYPALKLINTLLGGGMGSRLFINLRDKDGLAYEIGSFYPTRKFKSKFVIYLGLDGKNLNKARNKILDELKKLKEEKLNEEELSNIKNYLKGTFILDHQTNKRQAWYLGWHEIIGKGYLYDNLYLKELEEVTAEDISHTAQKYFNENNWTAIEIIPEGK